jgi:hypothetical protein
MNGEDYNCTPSGYNFMGENPVSSKVNVLFYSISQKKYCFTQTKWTQINTLQVKS